MSLEENKSVAKKLMMAIANNNVEELDELTSDDLVWWVSPNTAFSGSSNKQQWLKIVPQLFVEAAGPFTFRFDEVTAEEDRVSLTAKGHLLLKNGKVYENDYHLLFWVQNGKVSRCKEYIDSVHVGKIFGAP